MNIPEPIKVDISHIVNFDHFIQEVKDRYDAVLIDCFEKCGFAKDYILEHSDEFSTISRFDVEWTTYEWKGEPIFTIYKMRDYEESFRPLSDFFNKYEVQIYAEFYPLEQKA